MPCQIDSGGCDCDCAHGAFDYRIGGACKRDDASMMVGIKRCMQNPYTAGGFRCGCDFRNYRRISSFRKVGDALYDLTGDGSVLASYRISPLRMTVEIRFVPTRTARSR